MRKVLLGKSNRWKSDKLNNTTFLQYVQQNLLNILFVCHFYCKEKKLNLKKVLFYWMTAPFSLKINF